MFLSVKDDGKGYDSKISKNKKLSIGLKSIEARTAIWQADIEIKSIENQGTEIKIAIPIND